MEYFEIRQICRLRRMRALSNLEGGTEIGVLDGGAIDARQDGPEPQDKGTWKGKGTVWGGPLCLREWKVAGTGAWKEHTPLPFHNPHANDQGVPDPAVSASACISPL